MVAMMTNADTETFVFDEEVEAAVGRVRVVEGPDAGAQLEFASSSILVGSGEHADLRLTDRTVSKLHCELVRDGRIVRLRDLGSKNGCWLFGVRVGEVVLGPGVRVRVGSTTIETDVDRRRLRRPAWRGGDRFGDVLGASPAMHELFARAARVARTEETVLLRGESGTGKELLARAIHEASSRAGGPFVVLDCAAISRGVADLELFGTERGAFTGADASRPGLFERASGGTLFLDEVAELPLDLQPKLLRALERREVRRLGSQSWIPVDLRVVAATHAPLERMVNEESFREDLLYRLAVVELGVPPLRERGRDAPMLALHFARSLGVTDPAVLAEVEREVAGRLAERWPGNARELRTFVRRVVLLGAGVESQSREAGLDTPAIRVDMTFHDAKKSYVREFERQYVAQLLDECGGNASEVARRAGLNRQYLYELLERHGLLRR